MDPLDELMQLSKRWASVGRVDDVATLAIGFIRDTFNIDAGFVNYERKPLNDGVDYLKAPRRWFSSWGYDCSDKTLRAAVAASMHFTRELQVRKWFSAEEVPDVWHDINRANGILQVGIWLITFRDVPTGVFVFARRTAELMGDEHIISQCMTHISVVLESVVSRRIAEECSVRDPLTGLLNRRGFMREFERMAESTEETHNLMLAVLDVDGFKRINDSLGHLAGDEVLVKVGEVLQQHIQSYHGICARLGGDEFAVLAQLETDDVDASAKQVALWCRDSSVEASVGCAVLGPDGHSFDDCYRAADHRLYERKRTLPSRGTRVLDT